ncbi:MAG: hypothetical protein MUF02_05050 [Acidobacteria bacterium]|nr:hypothetical protein [Acidobacteriota bacterium]
MRKTPMFLLAGLALLGGCRRAQPLLVPEISPPLVQEEVCSWEGRLAGDDIFPCAGGIGWVDAAGRIIAWDVEKKAIAEVFAVPFKVKARPFRQGDLLLLQDQASDRMVVFDLAANGMKFESLHLGAKRVLGAGADGLVLQDGQRLSVRLWDKPTEVFHAQEDDERFFNCHFSPERILVLGRKRLFIFWKQARRFESRLLPQPAASPFLCVGESIYFGTTRRSLVKFPLQRGGAQWELKLGQVLERQPLAFAGTIVACANDQNVLQVNRRGTVLWWQALGSTMSRDLLPMSRHLAAVLLNREIRFLDPTLQKVTVFKSSGHALGAPLVFHGDLWFMAHDGKTCRLQRIGSRFGCEIELEPAAVRWLNRSLRFTLHFHNLPAPSWECVIRDVAGREAFRRSSVAAGRYGPVTLAWVPLQAGAYTIHLRVRSKGREWESAAPVQVLDPLRVAPAFYLHF